MKPTNERSNNAWRYNENSCRVWYIRNHGACLHVDWLPNKPKHLQYEVELEEMGKRYRQIPVIRSWRCVDDNLRILIGREVARLGH